MRTMKVETFKMLFKLGPVVGEELTFGKETLFVSAIKDGVITFQEGNSTAKSIPGTSGHTELYVNSEIYLKVERDTAVFRLPKMLKHGTWYSGKIIALPDNGSAVIECNDGSTTEIVYVESNCLRNDTIMLASKADFSQMLHNIELKIIEGNLTKTNPGMKAINYFRQMDETGLSMLRDQAISKADKCDLNGNTIERYASFR